MFFVRKAVQSACDLGALADVQELDWDLLALGTVSLKAEEAEAVAEAVTADNLEGILTLVRDVHVSAAVLNPPAKAEPTAAVTVTYSEPVYGSLAALAATLVGSVVLTEIKWRRSRRDHN